MSALVESVHHYTGDRESGNVSYRLVTSETGIRTSSRFGVIDAPMNYILRPVSSRRLLGLNDSNSKHDSKPIFPHSTNYFQTDSRLDWSILDRCSCRKEVECSGSVYH